MKKIPLLSAFIILFTGCATYITVMNDPYANEMVVKYEKPFMVIEGKLKSTRTCFTRRIKNGVKAPATIEIELKGDTGRRKGYHGEGLDEEAYVLVDSTSFPIKLQSRKNNKSMSLSGHETGRGIMTDSSLSMHSTLTASLDYECYLAAAITMTPDMEKAMEKASKLSIRISTGGKHTILKASDSQLEMIREFIAFTPEHK